jgi:endonuclease IV
MVRKESPTEHAFKSTDDVIANVWQTNTIGRYIDFKATFAAGRIYRPATS